MVRLTCKDWQSERWPLAKLFHEELWEIEAKYEGSGDPLWDENWEFYGEWNLVCAAISVIRNSPDNSGYTREQALAELHRLVVKYISNSSEAWDFIMANVSS